MGALRAYEDSAGMVAEAREKVGQLAAAQTCGVPENGALLTQATREAVRVLLENAGSLGYDAWTLQGFGMLRLYLSRDKSMRLHVWDDRYAVPHVSEMHDHPWDFDSVVVTGEVRNHRFRQMIPNEKTEPLLAFDYFRREQGLEMFRRQTIRCGEGGCEVGGLEDVVLRREPEEIVRAGRSYRQAANEIHVSRPLRGSVTIVKRTVPEGGDPDFAHVFIEPGQPWVSAEPRLATPEEIAAITGTALLTWF